VDTIIVNQRTGYVVDGHLRVALALRKHEKAVPVQYVDLDENEEALILATLDPIAAMASTDVDKLGELMRGIKSDDDRIAAMLEEIGQKEGVPRGEPPEDPGPELDRAEELREKWGIELGQLWQIGEHRLVCVDCTEMAFIEAITGGQPMDACVTDPPTMLASTMRTTDRISRQKLIIATFLRNGFYWLGKHRMCWYSPLAVVKR
jgi:hypothetical protein